MTTTTITVSTGRLADVLRRISSFERKARTWGVDGVRSSVSEPRVVEERKLAPWAAEFIFETGQPIPSEYFITTQHEVVDVTLTAPVIRSVEGWELRGVVEWHEGHDAWEAVVVAAPGFEGKRPSAPTVNICEHCNAIRNRKTTYIVQGPDGESRQVGRQCIKAYTGIDPERVMSLASLVSDLRDMGDINEDGEWCGRNRGVEVVAPDAIVRATCRVAVKRGWTSKSAASVDASKTATATIVELILFPDKPEDVKKLQEAYPWDDKAQALYAETNATIAGLDPESIDNYISTLAQLSRLKGINVKRVSYYASVVGLTIKQRNKKTEEAARPLALKPNVEEGEKIERDVEVLFRRETPGIYGTVTVIKFAEDTAEGRRHYAWFASGCPGGFNVGDRLRIKGTVKQIETDRYTGELQATLTRVKAL